MISLVFCFSLFSVFRLFSFYAFRFRVSLFIYTVIICLRVLGCFSSIVCFRFFF